MTDPLRKKVIAGLFWSVIQGAGAKLLTLGIFVVLARVLEPQELGVFATAMAVMGFLVLFADQGLGDAIVQRAEITREQLNAVFVINLGLASVIFIVLLITAPMIASYMCMPQLTDILRIAGVGIVINALSFTQQAMHRRNFGYRWLALCSLVSTLVAGVVGVFLALHGFGAVSLVIQSLTGFAINTALLWTKTQWRFSFEFDFRGAIALLRYGASRLGTNLLHFGNTRSIEIFLASSLGPSALGLYLVGARVYEALLQFLSSAVLDVAHNGFSRLAHDRPAAIAAYMKAMTITAAVAVPPFCLLATLAPEVSSVVFGSKWAESADVMRPMALLGALQVLQFYNGTLCNALGKPSWVLALMIMRTTITVATLCLMTDTSLVAIVNAYVLAQLITSPPSFLLARHVAGTSLRKTFWAIGPFVAACIAAMAVVFGVRQLDLIGKMPDYLRLAALGATGVVTYLVVVISVARPELVAMFFALTKKQPIQNS